MQSLLPSELTAEVRVLIAEAVRRPVDDVPLDALLGPAGLDLDSLALIKLNVALEERFDITLPDFDSIEAAEVRCVGDVVSLVAARLDARESASRLVGAAS